MNSSLKKFRLDSNILEVSKKAVPTAFVKLAGMVLSIIVSVFIGRTLGAEGLGVINLANRILAVLLVVCMFGMRQVLIKEIAIGRNRGDLKRIGDSLKTAYFLNVVISIVVSLSLIILSPWLANSFFKVPELEWVLVLSFVRQGRPICFKWVYLHQQMPHTYIYIYMYIYNNNNIIYIPYQI